MAEVSFSFSLQYLATTSIFDANIQEIFPPAEIELFCAPATYRSTVFKLPFKSEIEKKSHIFALKYESSPHHDSDGNINYDYFAVKLPYISGIIDLPRTVTKYFNFKYESEFQTYEKSKFTFGFPFTFENEYRFGFGFKSLSVERRVPGSITIGTSGLDIEIDLSGVDPQEGEDYYTLVIDNGRYLINNRDIRITRPGTVDHNFGSLVTDTSGSDVFNINISFADQSNTCSVTLLDNQNNMFGSLVSYASWPEHPVVLTGSEIKTRYLASSACCLTTVKCSPEEVPSFTSPKSEETPLGDRTTPPDPDEYLDPPGGGGGQDESDGSDGEGAEPIVQPDPEGMGSYYRRLWFLGLYG